MTPRRAEHMVGDAMRSLSADHPRRATGPGNSEQQNARGRRPSLGLALERDRVELRVSRLERVVAALRVRLAEHRAEAAPSARHLGRALSDFEAELGELRRSLRELDLRLSAAAGERS